MTIKAVQSRHSAVACIPILLGLVFSFLCVYVQDVNAQDTTPPTVVSTDPANGATNVPVDLPGVTVTFSEPMTPASQTMTDSYFWDSSESPPYWLNQTTLYIPRNAQAPPLPVGVSLTFILNPISPVIRDLAGNPLGTYSFSFLIGTDIDEIPTVVSTNPTDGATGVSRDLEVVSITFSEWMNTCCASIASNFPSYSISWSEDHKTVYLTRDDLQTRLSGGLSYTFTLNGEGYENFRDTQGNFLPETVFSFTTAEEYDYQLYKIPADSSKGFEWPYYLSVPNNLSRSTILLVEPNNTGTWSDDWSVHDAAAENLAKTRSDFAIALDVPLLVPTFPRPINPPAPEPGGIYTHALDRYSLLTDAVIDGHSIQRIDLQLIAMIHDAQERLSAMGFQLDSKVFMMGFSASGAFTNRFSLLHPEIVRAAAPGAPGAWPIAPIVSWQDNTLRYPVGVADVEVLTGSPFDLAAYKKVPQYIYIGDLDRNDALDVRGIPQEERDAICALLDCRPEPYVSDRWPIAEAMHESADVSNQFVVYPGIAHTISDEMFQDILQFFGSHKSKEMKSLPWLPLLLDD